MHTITIPTIFILLHALFLNYPPFVSAFPFSLIRHQHKTIGKRAIDPSLILEFGHQSGLNPTGTGDCDSIIPGGPKIPCDCPPARDEFIRQLNANVDAGHAVNNVGVGISFPLGSDLQSQITRITAHLITLQNLKGGGVGCPDISTTFATRQAALQAQLDQNPGLQTQVPATTTPTSTSTSTSTQPPTTVIVTMFISCSPSTSASPGPLSPIAQLAPEFGWISGVNPSGSGDCDSAKPGGLPKIPCQCPPPRGEFIRQLEANVAAGRALKNPTVAVEYPADDSNASKRMRIIASLITLQNMEGVGIGCPAESTTFSEQLAAIPT